MWSFIGCEIKQKQQTGILVEIKKIYLILFEKKKRLEMKLKKYKFAKAKATLHH